MGFSSCPGGGTNCPKAIDRGESEQRHGKPLALRLVEHPPSIRFPRSEEANPEFVDSYIPGDIDSVPSRETVVRPSIQGLILLTAIAYFLCLYAICRCLREEDKED